MKDSVRLACCCSLLAVLCVAREDQQLESQLCLKISERACVWISRPREHNEVAHLVIPCVGIGSKCVFNTTCFVNGAYRDVYACKEKPDLENSEHPRIRRAAPPEEKPAESEVTRRIPLIFQKIMRRHRAYNADAFNGGTYLIDGMKYQQKESINVGPVMGNGATGSKDKHQE